MLSYRYIGSTSLLPNVNFSQLVSYKAVCTVTTRRLYCHYKPFVAPLQSTCSVTTKQL